MSEGNQDNSVLLPLATSMPFGLLYFLVDRVLETDSPAMGSKTKTQNVANDWVVTCSRYKQFEFSACGVSRLFQTKVDDLNEDVVFGKQGRKQKLVQCLCGRSKSDLAWLSDELKDFVRALHGSVPRSSIETVTGDMVSSKTPENVEGFLKRMNCTLRASDQRWATKTDREWDEFALSLLGFPAPLLYSKRVLRLLDAFQIAKTTIDAKSPVVQQTGQPGSGPEPNRTKWFRALCALMPLACGVFAKDAQQASKQRTESIVELERLSRFSKDLADAQPSERLERFAEFVVAVFETARKQVVDPETPAPAPGAQSENTPLYLAVYLLGMTKSRALMHLLMASLLEPESVSFTKVHVVLEDFDRKFVGWDQWKDTVEAAKTHYTDLSKIEKPAVMSSQVPVLRFPKPTRGSAPNDRLVLPWVLKSLSKTQLEEASFASALFVQLLAAESLRISKWAQQPLYTPPLPDGATKAWPVYLDRENPPSRGGEELRFVYDDTRKLYVSQDAGASQSQTRTLTMSQQLSDAVKQAVERRSPQAGPEQSVSETPNATLLSKTRYKALVSVASAQTLRDALLSLNELVSQLVNDAAVRAVELARQKFSAVQPLTTEQMEDHPEFMDLGEAIAQLVALPWARILDKKRKRPPPRDTAKPETEPVSFTVAFLGVRTKLPDKRKHEVGVQLENAVPRKRAPSFVMQLGTLQKLFGALGRALRPGAAAVMYDVVYRLRTDEASEASVLSEFNGDAAAATNRETVFEWMKNGDAFKLESVRGHYLFLPTSENQQKTAQSKNEAEPAERLRQALLTALLSSATSGQAVSPTTVSPENWMVLGKHERVFFESSNEELFQSASRSTGSGPRTPVVPLPAVELPKEESALLALYAFPFQLEYAQWSELALSENRAASSRKRRPVQQASGAEDQRDSFLKLKVLGAVYPTKSTFVLRDQFVFEAPQPPVVPGSDAPVPPPPPPRREGRTGLPSSLPLRLFRFVVQRKAKPPPRARATTPSDSAPQPAGGTDAQPGSLPDKLAEDEFLYWANLFDKRIKSRFSLEAGQLAATVQQLALQEAPSGSGNGDACGKPLKAASAFLDRVQRLASASNWDIKNLQIKVSV